MNRQEYHLMVENWNNFLLTEEKIISEQKVLLETIINEGFLENLRSKGIKKSIAIPLLFVKMLSLYPTQGYSEPITSNKIVATAERHGHEISPEDAKKAVELAIESQELDSEGKPTSEYTSGGSSSSEGLASTMTGSGGPKLNGMSGWKFVQDISKKSRSIDNLKNLAQKDIDEASKKIGVKSISYTLYYLHSTNMVKFDANIKNMKTFIEKYKSGASFDSVKKVSKFVERGVSKKNGVPFLELSYAYAAIKTCSELPKECANFKSGVERSSTQARYSGNVKGGKESGKKIAFNKTTELSDKFAGHSGKIFKRNLYEASEVLYKMGEQIKSKGKLSLKDIPSSGLFCRVAHNLITKDGKIDQNKMSSLFNKIAETGNQFIESGQTEAHIDSEAHKGSAASNKNLNTGKIIQKQSDFLDQELASESLVKIFNII